MKLSEIWERLLAMAYVPSEYRYRLGAPDNKPGSLVSLLSDEEREILKDFKAENCSQKTIRRGELEVYNYSREQEDEKQFVKSKLDFDKKLKK